MVAFGWEEDHPHQFAMGPKRQLKKTRPFLTDDQVDPAELDPAAQHEAHVRLGEALGIKGHRLYYLYDFGDKWRHTLILEDVRPREEGEPRARCLDGDRAGPPEDSGGVSGLMNVLTVLSGRSPTRADCFEVLEIIPDEYDPTFVDIESIDRQLRTYFGTSGEPGVDDSSLTIEVRPVVAHCTPSSARPDGSC